MRDINRIDLICDKIKELWKCYPDERLGQFFMNHIFNDGADPFFREDVRETWMNNEYKTWEDVIDAQIIDIKLFERVKAETNYLKDYDEWMEKDMEWIKKYCRVAPSENGLYLEEKSTKPEPKRPDWKDYIKELK